MFTVLLPLGVNPIAVNKHIYIYILCYIFKARCHLKHSVTERNNIRTAKWTTIIFLAVVKQTESSTTYNFRTRKKICTKLGERHMIIKKLLKQMERRINNSSHTMVILKIHHHSCMCQSYWWSTGGLNSLSTYLDLKTKAETFLTNSYSLLKKLIHSYGSNEIIWTANWYSWFCMKQTTRCIKYPTFILS